MRNVTRIGAVVMAARLAAALLLGGLQSATAHDAEHHAAPADVKPQAAKPHAAKVMLHDTQLVNSDGEAVRFKSEAIGDRIVVVSFIYTSCTTICPMTSLVFADVQERLLEKFGDRFGRDVKL